MPKDKIETSGDLREFLANMMLGIRNGDLSTERAATMVKVAQQVNESFYSEIKTKQLHISAKEQTHALGALPLAEQR